jgi:DNA-binding NarL/FixJ family response regulator
MGKTAVLLADDHTMFRQGLRQLLELEPDIQVVGEASTGAEAVAAALRLQPDVVVMDVHMPGMNGVEAARQIMNGSARTRVIMLSMYHQEETVFEAIKAGATGYLLKDADAEELVRAIRSASRGEAIVEPAVAAKVLNEFARMAAQVSPAQRLGLTEREGQILALVARGDSNKRIAAQLGLSEKTVKNYLTIIFQKLHVGSRTEAAILALREGFGRLQLPS